MTFFGLRPRPILGACTAMLSVAAGFVLVFRLLTPGTLDRIPTAVLIGLLALLALPLLAVWAVIAERRAAVRLQILGAARAGGVFEAPGSILDLDRPRVAALFPSPLMIPTIEHDAGAQAGSAPAPGRRARGRRLARARNSSPSRPRQA